MLSPGRSTMRSQLLADPMAHRWRFTLAWLLVGLLLGVLLVGCFAGKPEGPGRIQLSPSELDLGPIPNTGPVSRTLKVRNVGRGWLEITGLSTSCGCTTAELSSRVIPPGHRADLTVTFDADYHPARGNVTRLVWFVTNDPTQPWVEVRITADVRQ